MVDHLLFALAVLLPAAAFALLEIQIEGADGWADRLPTWHMKNRWTEIIFGPRPLTGYHLYFWLFLLLLVHVPYGLGIARPSWPAELRIVAFVCLFWIAEDFLWFVFNPKFGVRQFRADAIWWHRASWWWIMPREYWVFGFAGVVLYAAAWRL